MLLYSIKIVQNAHNIRDSMYKQIIFSLLIILSIPTNGMHLAFHNPQILAHITEQLCITHQWEPKSTRKDMRALSITDKFLRTYYSREKTGKKIIRSMALYHNTSDVVLAHYFGYKKIAKKIDALFDIINQPHGAHFSTDQFKNTWYLNATQSSGHIHKQQNLLLAAIEDLKLKKVKALIDAGIDCNSTRCTDPIALMADLNYHSLNKYNKKSFYAIVRLLLDNNIHPDSRNFVTNLTLLHQAVLHNNPHLARTLLKKGANPYALYINELLSPLPGTTIRTKFSIHDTLIHYDSKNPSHVNAFCMENSKPKGLLAALIEDITQSNYLHSGE
jgi:hypothetical protein